MNSIRRRRDETYILNLTGPFQLVDPETFILSIFHRFNFVRRTRTRETKRVEFSISDIFRRCGNIILVYFRTAPHVYDVSHISLLLIYGRQIRAFILSHHIWALRRALALKLSTGVINWILNQQDKENRINLSLSLLHVRAPQQCSCVSSCVMYTSEGTRLQTCKKTLGYCVLFIYRKKNTHS